MTCRTLVARGRMKEPRLSSSTPAPGTPASRGLPPLAAATAAAAVIAVQAVALIAAGVWLMVRALGHDAQHRGSDEVLGAMSVVVGVGVCYLARAVWRRNGRVRSLLLILELIALPIAYSVWQGGRWYVGLPLGLSAILALVLTGRAGLLTPSDRDLD